MTNTEYVDGNAPVPDPNEQIADLVRQLTTSQDQAVALTRRVAALQEHNSRIERDIDIIAEALRDEAIRREWCSEYGEFIDRLNGRISREWLQHCTEERIAVFQVRVVYTCRTSERASAANEIAGYLDLEGIDLSGDASIENVGVTLRSNDMA